jgi:hypothetical protein
MEAQMIKRIVSAICLVVLSAFLIAALTAAAPAPGPVPNVTFTLLSAPPATMNVGDTANVVVQVTSDQQFLFAAMLPTFHFPGRGLMATDMGGDRVSNNTTATLTITFVAKGSTLGLPDEGVCPTGGVAPVAVVAGARFPGGFTARQRFPANGFFCVTVP